MNVSPLGRSMSVRQINGKRLSDKKQVVGEENKKHFHYMQSGFQFGVARGQWILLCAAPCTHAYIPKPEFAGARQQEGNLGFVVTNSKQPGHQFSLIFESPWHQNPFHTTLVALSCLKSGQEKKRNGNVKTHFSHVNGC